MRLAMIKPKLIIYDNYAAWSWPINEPYCHRSRSIFFVKINIWKPQMEVYTAIYIHQSLYQIDKKEERV